MNLNRIISLNEIICVPTPSLYLWRLCSMLSQDNALVQFLGGEFLNRRISNKGGGIDYGNTTQHFYTSKLFVNCVWAWQAVYTQSMYDYMIYSNPNRIIYVLLELIIKPLGWGSTYNNVCMIKCQSLWLHLQMLYNFAICLLSLYKSNRMSVSESVCLFVSKLHQND